jgi:hypothetical protein
MTIPQLCSRIEPDSMYSLNLYPGGATSILFIGTVRKLYLYKPWSARKTDIGLMALRKPKPHFVGIVRCTGTGF